MITRELMVVVGVDELSKALSIVSEGGTEYVDVLAVPLDDGMICYLTRKLEWHEREEDFLPLKHWEDVFSALEMMDWVYNFSKVYPAKT